MLDDGFGVVERKDVATAMDLRHIANADLCVVKLACQHSAACAGFVWNPATSSAVLKTSVATEHWAEPDRAQGETSARNAARAQAQKINEQVSLRGGGGGLKGVDAAGHLNLPLLCPYPCQRRKEKQEKKKAGQGSR